VLAYPLEELLAEKIRSLLERANPGIITMYGGSLRSILPLRPRASGHGAAKKLSHKNLNVTTVGDFMPRDTKG
jgi:hypothetical protein